MEKCSVFKIAAVETVFRKINIRKTYSRYIKILDSHILRYVFANAAFLLFRVCKMGKTKIITRNGRSPASGSAWVNGKHLLSVYHVFYFTTSPVQGKIIKEYKPCAGIAVHPLRMQSQSVVPCVAKAAERIYVPAKIANSFSPVHAATAVSRVQNCRQTRNVQISAIGSL